MKKNKKFKKIAAVIVSALAIVMLIGTKFDIPIISIGVDYLMFPFQKGFSFVRNGTSGVFSRFKDIDDLLTENEILKKENARLTYENSILEEYKDENDNLKKLLDMKQRYSEYPSVGSNVIGKETGNWYKVFTIDKGSMNNISENDVILSDGSLVGHVIEVYPLSSKVLSIMDDRSSASVKVVRTGDIGILRGDIERVNEGLTKLEINSPSDIIKGDQIVTSHLSSIYPPGIPVGTVEEVVTGKDGLTQYAYVRCFVDFKHIKEILVMQTKND